VSPEPAARFIALEGWGVHSGEPARVVLRAGAPGAPVVLRAVGRPACEAPLSAFRVAATLRATTIECRTPGGLLRVATVEHLLGALAGLGVFEGLVVEVDGPELPLLDGGGARWAEAVDSLGLQPGAPPLRIARREVIEVGASRYECSPGPTQVVQAVFESDDPRLASTAEWTGDRADFRRRIAPARTFALASDAEDLLASGLARRVDPSSVVLVTREAIHASGAPFTPDEPARHKLLDLMGDLYLAGGPPLGALKAVRPGHAANAEACRLGLARGVFVR
jgi:UDP-3-O-[3-hydroxymyristoyl] N-acetylglucosamine deacetylase